MSPGGTPRAKAAFWPAADAEARKHGERTGLDTRVVRAVEVGHLPSRVDPPGGAANATSVPPGEYGRKVEIQRNWRGSHKRRSAWFNPIQSGEPYQGLTCRQ